MFEAIALMLTQTASDHPSTWWPIPERVTPVEATQAIIQCGVPERNLRVQNDLTLQEDVVRVAVLRSPSRALLTCIAAASLKTTYYVVFGDAAAQHIYDPIYFRLQEEKGSRDARKVLADHGLLDKLPSYRPGRDNLLRIAGDLEALCGVRRGTLLTLATPNMLTTSPDSLSKTSDDQLGCVLNAASASRIPVGFVGNEAIADKRRR